MMKNAMINLILVVLVHTSALAQGNGSGYPEIDKPIPEFVLKNIHYYDSKEMTSSDFKGKPVILDFWNKRCSSCIASFPEINNLQNKFKDRVDIILVGLDEEGIALTYERFRNRLGLTIPVAYDSALYNRFVPFGVPHQVWIDGNGIVKAITTSFDLTEKNLEAFLAGQVFKFRDESYAALNQSKSYDFKVPFLVDGNGGKGSNFLYRSLLAEYHPGMPFKMIDTPVELVCKDDFYFKGKLEGTTNLGKLYKLAYFGGWEFYYGTPFYKKYYNRLVLEIEDPAIFYANDRTGENFFWYSLIVPPTKATPDYIQGVMQRDLYNYFGYTVKIEVRKMPYWKLVVTDKAKSKLKTKGGNRFSDGDYTFYKARNISIEELFSYLFFFIQEGEIPILNETGMEEHIDIDIKVSILDFEAIKTELSKHGINLVKAEKEFKVIVISENNS